MTPGRGGVWCTVEGTFHRGISARYRSDALVGSRRAGRYCAADQPTLYLSASPEGVTAAMRTHVRPDDFVTVAFTVSADRVLDLRDPVAMAVADIDPADASAPWRDAVADGGRPRSWDVRDRATALGAHGLIDPSRTAPGLWHLVLFRWNTPGAPMVEPQ